MERTLQELYGTKDMFLRSPPNLVVSHYKLTAGEQYDKPREVIFGNPGVVSVGQFPTYYDAIPNEAMWQDEAYNTAKRRFAKETELYLRQNPREMFSVPDPVIKTLIEDQESAVERLIEEVKLMEAKEKKSAQMRMLLQRGYTAEKAMDLIEQVDDDNAREALRRGETLPNVNRRITFEPGSALRRGDRFEMASPETPRRKRPQVAPGPFPDEVVVDEEDVFRDRPRVPRTPAPPRAMAPMPKTPKAFTEAEIDGFIEILKEHPKKNYNVAQLKAIAQRLGVPDEGLIKSALRKKIVDKL
jgi:hypothetical protein